LSLLLGLAGAPAVDVKVSWLEFDSGGTPIDVKVSWLQFDSAAAAADVRVSWLAFDTQAPSADVRVSWLQFDTQATPEPEQTLGGVTRRPFPQVQRRRETEEEKLARRIEQGIVRAAEPEPVAQPVAEPVPDGLAAKERQLQRRIKRAQAANQQALEYIEAATAQALAAQIADEEIRRIQAIRAQETEEADIAFVMALLANA
jgi:hypothetical protein